ncbi:MAG: hypothetical protein L0211_02900 [Planctomycetaceae bacterium]|nr:hypothetical protein [Planctomycetaceae bacterium]
MKSHECENELDWSAFCYAAGEMNAADAAAFEQRLAEDQAAREALARAVELTEAVAAAESLEPAVTLNEATWNWSRRLGWMAIGSAASLLVALLWSGAGSWFISQPSGTGDQSQLAAAWSLTRQELADSESDLWYPKHLSASEAVEPAELTGQAGGFDEVDSATPAWLTAAVESYPNEPSDPDNTPFDGERSNN